MIMHDACHPPTPPAPPFIACSLNCRSLLNANKRVALRAWVRDRTARRPGIFFLQETWQHSPQQWAPNGFGRPYAAAVWAPYAAASSPCRGVGILVDGDLAQLEVLHRCGNGRMLVAELRWTRSDPLLLASVYAPTSAAEQPAFFKALFDRVAALTEARPYLKGRILIGGDFNTTCSALDRVGAVASGSASAVLSDFVRGAGLVDCWRSLNPLSTEWSRAHTTSASRIDFIFSSSPAASSRMVPAPIATDHRVVEVEFGRKEPAAFRLWRLPRAMISDATFIETVSTYLEPFCRAPDHAVWRDWRFIKDTITRMAQAHARRTRESHRDTERVLHEECERAARAALERPSPERIAEARRAEFALASARELLYSARLQDELARDGFDVYDTRPTDSSRESGPRVLRLPTGVSLSAPQAITEHLTRHFAQLYAAEPTSVAAIQELLTSWSPPPLGENRIRALSRPFAPAEVAATLKRMARGSSPGPDGLPYELYSALPATFSSLLLKLLRHSLRCGSFPAGFSESVVRLIPKAGKDTEQVGGWRPLTLLNADYKVLSQVVNGRLQTALASLVGDSQVGFMPGRRIDDHLLTMRAAAECEFGAVLITDDDAAYDRVDRHWLSTVASSSLPPFLCRSISLFLAPARSRLLTDALSAPFVIARGVPQGLPLSPTLYNLACEPMLAAVRSSQCAGFPLPMGGSLVVQAYADDKAFFLASADDLAVVRAVIATYESAAGARISAAKSLLIILDGSPTVRWADVWPELVIRTATPTLLASTTYLGIPLAGPPWARALRRFEVGLAHWKRRHLPLFARAVAANKFLAPLFTYAASVCAPTPEILVAVDQRLAAFVWNSAIAPVPNIALFVPRSAGGVGVRRVGTATYARHVALLQRVHAKLAYGEFDAAASSLSSMPPWLQLACIALRHARPSTDAPVVLLPAIRADIDAFVSAHPRLWPASELRHLLRSGLAEFGRLGGTGRLCVDDGDPARYCRIETSDDLFAELTNRQLYNALLEIELRRNPWSTPAWGPARGARRPEAFWRQVHAAHSSFSMREARWRAINACFPLHGRVYRADDRRSLCPRCGAERESHEHALTACPAVMELWRVVLRRMARVLGMVSATDPVRAFAHPAAIAAPRGLLPSRRLQLAFVVNVVCRAVWTTRSDVTDGPALLRLFEAALRASLKVLTRVRPEFKEWPAQLQGLLQDVPLRPLA